MSLLDKIKKIIKHPELLGIYIVQKCTLLIPEKLYLKLLFRLKGGYWMNIDNPTTFNEKLNWLKIYNRRPEYSVMADKSLVKEYVAERIGYQYVIPCYAKYNSFEEMNLEQLPMQFAVKMTHNSSGAFLVKDKTQLDVNALKSYIDRYFDFNYYWHLREWPYKNIQPAIIVEQLLSDGTCEVLRDYKFWCFNGKPLYMYCTVKGVKDVYENFYDMDFMPININHGYPRHIPEFEKPLSFELMKELATTLAAGIPFVRVDFYEIDGVPYFGEFTFFDWGGMQPFATLNQDVELGALIDLQNE